MEYQLTTGDFCVDETTYTAYGIRYGDILFDDVTLDDWQAATVGKITVPFTFTRCELLDRIEVQ